MSSVGISEGLKLLGNDGVASEASIYRLVSR